MYEHREIFASPPLELVVAEMRYPFAPRLRQQEVLDKIQLELEQLLPMRRSDRQVTFEFAADGSQSNTTVDVFRLTNRSATVAASITPSSASIETTSYVEFFQFLEVIRPIAAALAEEGRVPALERLGLRYLDEIRVPGVISAASDWSDWVTPSLTAAVQETNMPVQSFHTMVNYTTGENMTMRFQCAALDGPGLITDGVLRRRRPATTGPFFVLDIDSFWQAPSPEHVRDFDVDHIVDMFSLLHVPTGERFQMSLTDQLRAVFRKAEG